MFMIDWFASKLGLLIFIMVAVSALVGMVLVQIDVFSYNTKVQTANDIARLVDSMVEDSSLTYEMPKEYNISLTANKVIVEDVERHFISDASPTNLQSKQIKLEKTGGTVYITGV